MAKKEKAEAVESSDPQAQNDTANDKPEVAVVDPAPAGPQFQPSARAFCSCGNRMLRLLPKNAAEAAKNKWSCELVWMGRPTPICQKNIPAHKILTKEQAAAMDEELRKRQQDAENDD